jgi:death-on-curing protein
VIEYLSIDQVLDLHRRQIRAFGGASGIRDRGALESAVARPQATFGGEDLYPDVVTKAAALTFGQCVPVCDWLFAHWIS